MNAPPRCRPSCRYRCSPSACKLGDVDRDLDKPEPGQPSRQHPGAATEEIVARARVTRGVLYHHFRDKTDLFGAVMQTVAGELAQRLIARQLSGGT
jgi:Bacterial regulatory proteins, tetR family